MSTLTRRWALARQLAARHRPPERAWEGDYGQRHGEARYQGHSADSTPAPDRAAAARAVACIELRRA